MKSFVVRLAFIFLVLNIVPFSNALASDSLEGLQDRKEQIDQDENFEDIDLTEYKSLKEFRDFLADFFSKHSNVSYPYPINYEICRVHFFPESEKAFKQRHVQERLVLFWALKPEIRNRCQGWVRRLLMHNMTVEDLREEAVGEYKNFLIQKDSLDSLEKYTIDQINKDIHIVTGFPWKFSICDFKPNSFKMWMESNRFVFEARKEFVDDFFSGNLPLLLRKKINIENIATFESEDAVQSFGRNWRDALNEKRPIWEKFSLWCVLSGVDSKVVRKRWLEYDQEKQKKREESLKLYESIEQEQEWLASDPDLEDVKTYLTLISDQAKVSEFVSKKLDELKIRQSQDSICVKENKKPEGEVGKEESSSSDIELSALPGSRQGGTDAIVLPAKAKCFFKLHPRVERWRNTELGAIRRFKDKASDGLTLVQKYKDKSDNELKELMARHSLWALEDLLSNDEFRRDFVYNKIATNGDPVDSQSWQAKVAFIVYAKMELNGKVQDGEITIGIDNKNNVKTIYHAFFEPRAFKKNCILAKESASALFLASNSVEGFEVVLSRRKKRNDYRISEKEQGHKLLSVGKGSKLPVTFELIPWRKIVTSKLTKKAG